MKNWYSIQILVDPDLQQIKFNINGTNTSQDILAYIYTRFAPELLNIPFERNRKINDLSRQKALKLNKLMPPYQVKYDFNTNFYIDIERKTPVDFSNDNDDENYLISFFNSKKFIRKIKYLFNSQIYDWAVEHSKNSNLFPFRHLYGLFTIYKILDNLSINKTYFYNKI